MQIESIDQLQEALRGKNYVADRGLATAVFLALKLQRPLFLEGEPGVGKTEVAKVIADLLGTRLIRLQCYEGLDVNQAVYEWNYTRQMLHIRLLEARGERASEAELFGKEFLRLLLIAFLIATPVSWWAMNHWLEDYPSRIPLNAGVFLLALGATVLIAAITISAQSIKAALAHPVDSLRSE